MRLNIGFLGAGGIARKSVGPAVQRAKNARLYAVASRSVERSWELKPQRVYGEYDDLLADPDVDIVYIALHNSAHIRWIERALRNSKHVLCEKPLARTASEVTRAFDLARERGLLLTEASWNRWHPRTRTFEALLASGALGQVREVTARFHGDAPPRGNYRYDPATGGGALLDVGCYAVSAALSCFGWTLPEVTDVAVRRWWADSAESTVAARLTYPDGAGATVSASLAGDHGQELEVRGSIGRLRMTPPAFTAGSADCALEMWNGRSRFVQHFSRVDPYQLMVEAMVDRLLGKNTFQVASRQSWSVATVLDTILEAMRDPLTAPEVDRSAWHR